MMFFVFLTSAISMGVTFLYGCVGEIITEKSGHLNLGIPGIMCVGGFGGCLGVSIYMQSLSSPDNANWFLLIIISMFFSVLFSAMFGALYCFLTVTLRANQNVTGLAITTFGVGFTNYFVKNINMANFTKASALISYSPLKGKLGEFGDIFVSHGFFIYFAIVIAIVAALVLNKTRVGLNLRAVGENPATADAAGISVTKYRYIATIIGSMIAGLGGLFYIMDRLGGHWEYVLDIMGWLAIALVIFTLWKPIISIFGSILFGGLYIAGSYITGLSIHQKELFGLLPYVITVIVLIITSVLDSKENQPPAALGLNYFREDR